MIGAWMMAKSGDISKPDLIILAVVVTFIGVIVGFVVLSGGPSRATLVCFYILSCYGLVIIHSLVGGGGGTKSKMPVGKCFEILIYP